MILQNDHLPNFKHSYEGLLCGTVIGIIDHNGAVESFFIPVDEIGDWMHGDLFDFRGNQFRWRWDHRYGISTIEEMFSHVEQMGVEERDAVLRHLNKKYGIPFEGRCFHEEFNKLLKEERDNGI